MASFALNRVFLRVLCASVVKIKRWTRTATGGVLLWISASHRQRERLVKAAQRAEELGFTHAWFYDTQMITADPFVAMGVGGDENLEDPPRHRRPGAVEPHRRRHRQRLRHLERPRPRRIDFGVGTGFSARRAMGSAR